MKHSVRWLCRNVGVGVSAIPGADYCGGQTCIGPSKRGVGSARGAAAKVGRNHATACSRTASTFTGGSASIRARVRCRSICRSSFMGSAYSKRRRLCAGVQTIWIALRRDKPATVPKIPRHRFGFRLSHADRNPQKTKRDPSTERSRFRSGRFGPRRVGRV